MNTFGIRFSISNVDGQLIQTVNGRQMHTALDVRKDYANWVKAQIARARLVENMDFVKSRQKVLHSSTGQVCTDYEFTTNSAKHIAMMSNTAKSFSVRDYFIECERLLKQDSPYTQLPSTEFLASIEAARLPMQETNVSTYFIRNTLTRAIKIGRTTDINQRVKALSTASGAPLEVIYIVSKDIEAEMHTKFASQRCHGEWFDDASGEIEEFLVTLK